MKAWASAMLGQGQAQEAIAHNLEMLVRAYDSCISCSTHTLGVKFIQQKAVAGSVPLSYNRQWKDMRTT